MNSFKNLEELLEEESRTWWDQTTLKAYLDKNYIPRGLRVKKIPSNIYSETFVTEWNMILSECSSKLMNLIVKEETTKLQELSTKIEEIRQILKESTSNTDYDTQNLRIQQHIESLEEKIATTKKSKWLREEYDYINNRVYEWGRWERPPYTPKSILRKSYKKSRQQKVPKVSFLSTDQESSDCATQESESEAIESTPKKPSYYKKKRNSKSNLQQKNEEGGRKHHKSKRHPHMDTEEQQQEEIVL
ncbi:uncharacterized protein [Engystomops pustulosus]|uniref:uncharacterized protein n=1 Tax=Engystomops pustulosus TaxID=76066 RepID=UPI003AFAB822